MMPNYYEISLSYTLKCNALCDHCCVNAGPKNHIKMTFKNAKSYIEAAAVAGIKYIAYTGGEVTLFWSELIKLLQTAKDNGIRNIVVSNAHWATSPRTANSFAGKFQKYGVEEVQVSTDMFHQRFIPFQYVRNAIDAIHSNDMRPIVMLARMKWDDETERLLTQLKKLNVEIVQQPVVPFAGRSQLLPKDRLYSMNVDNMKHHGCVSILSPTVSPSNKVYACCASDFSFADSSALCLGDLSSDTLDKVLLAHQDDRIIDVLYLWGPKYIYDLVALEHPVLIQNIGEIYYGYCHLCYELMKRDEIVGFLRNKLKDPSIIKRIEIAKFVKHEKIKKNKDRGNEWYECVIEREEAQAANPKRQST